MNPLLKEIRHNPLLWLLVFVPVVFVAAEARARSAHAAVRAVGAGHRAAGRAAQSRHRIGRGQDRRRGRRPAQRHARQPDRTGHRARRACAPGEYMLVKASIAGAIVTNTLFMLGASFLLGGLKHHVQEFNRVSARLQAGLLFLATIALLDSVGDRRGRLRVRRRRSRSKLSVGLAVLLIVAYGLGMLFSLKTHRELFRQRGARRGRRSAVADRPGPGHAGRRHGAGGAGQRGLRRVGAEGGGGVRDDARRSSASSSSRWSAARRKWPRRFPARARTGWT